MEISDLDPIQMLRILQRAEAADNAQAEGVQIALELIRKIRVYQNQGIHLMPVGWDEIIPRIIREADLMPKNHFIPESV